MSFDAIPIWGVFVGTMAVIGAAIEAGYRLGRALREKRSAEEATASVISGSVLGLAAFMMAFTVGMVSERYDSRRALVREDADAIRTAWMRTDFLPRPDRAEAVGILRRYVDQRVKYARASNLDAAGTQAALAEATAMQDRLWDTAVANARLDMNSDVAALYIESLNEVVRVHTARVSVAIHARTPNELWLVLYAVTILAVFAMGYHNALAGSKRSAVQAVLIVSFAMVMAVIASLDRPDSGILKVSQRPLVELGRAMDARTPGS